MVLVPSTASKRFICSLGVAEDRIVITPYVVDNDYIASVASNTSRDGVRDQWQVPASAVVALFCAKFIPRKRPQDALQAFARAKVPNSYLVMVGEGPLADSLKEETRQLGIEEQVRFPGLIKYSRLPEAYAASDVLVFPSEHEPYGLPINEAMICGTPAIASDRVGAVYDLVEDGKTGFAYPCGDVEALSVILRRVFLDRELLKELGDAARMRMQSWSPRENAEATVRAVKKAIAWRSNVANGEQVTT
jgi:glycosyltransferase involved in cell wall biosynthesis